MRGDPAAHKAVSLCERHDKQLCISRRRQRAAAGTSECCADRSECLYSTVCGTSLRLRYTDLVTSTTTLWRPVGQRELELIAESGWSRFPPRLLGQPIFYPVLNEDYATKIARDWNTKDPASRHVGHVLRFEVEAVYQQQFPPHRVGGAGIDELDSAEQLDDFNEHIAGTFSSRSSQRFEVPGRRKLKVPLFDDTGTLRQARRSLRASLRSGHCCSEQ